MSADSEKQDASASRKPSNWLFLASASALMGAIGMGCVLGWTGTALVDMKRIDSVPQLTVDDKNIETWIGSCMTLSALVGGLICGPISQYLGRKKSLILYGVPFVLGWFLIFMAKSFTMIIAGRLITGLCCGLISGTAPSYVIEISTPSVRGLLGTCFQVCVTIGILMVNVFGSFLTWQWNAMLSLIPCALMTIMMIGMPETPIFLLLKSETTDSGKGSEAYLALSALRDASNDNESELAELAQQVKETKQSQSGFSMDQMKRPGVYKPFALAIALMFFQQFSGINAVIFYLGDIFRAASSLNTNVAVIIVSVAQVVATIVGSFLVDRLGRKVLLIASGVGHACSLFGLGIYYFAASGSSSTSSSWGWVPVLCLAVFIIAFSIGYGPIPWMMIPEITPNFARSAISGIATSFNWMCAFIITKNFELAISLVTRPGAYWIFAAICVISILFTFYFLPETKGKTFDEIQQNFTGMSGSSVSTPHTPVASMANSGGSNKNRGSVAEMFGSDKEIEMKKYEVNKN